MAGSRLVIVRRISKGGEQQETEAGGGWGLVRIDDERKNDWLEWNLYLRIEAGSIGCGW